MVRFAFFCVLASAACAAHASFELLLVTDSGTGSVHRFDPVTGTYLGSFGAGFMGSPGHIAIDESTGRAFITDNSLAKVWVFNYNTGEYVTDFASPSSPWGIVRLPNGNLLIGSASTPKIYSPAGAFISNMGTQSQGFGVGSDGVNLYSSEGGFLNKYTMSGTLVSSMAMPSFDAYQMEFRNGTGYLTGAGQNGKMATFSTATMNGFTLRTITNLNSGARVEGMSLSHGTTTYMLGQSTGNVAVGAISRFLLPAVGISTFGSSVLMHPVGSAIVIAPEPLSLTALAVGFAALIRRRRSQ